MPSSLDPGRLHLWNDADLRLLSVLHVLLETRSVTRAADRLGMGQPSVSRILARSRERFADPLLIRAGGRMVLTARAEHLRERLGVWLADGSALLTPGKVDPAAIARSFRIASTDFGVISVVRPSLAQIAATSPGVELFVRPLSSDSQRRQASGELDLVITGVQPDLSKAHALRLFEERHTCLTVRDHPGLRDGAMTVDDFCASPHIVIRVFDHVAADYEQAHPGVARRHLVTTDNFMMAPYLLKELAAVVTLPSRAAAVFARMHHLAVFEPPLPLPPFGYWVTWHERSHRDPETQWLIGQLAEPFRNASDAPA